MNIESPLLSKKRCTLFTFQQEKGSEKDTFYSRYFISEVK